MVADRASTTESVAEQILRDAGICQKTKQKATWYVAFCNEHGREPSREEMQKWETDNA